MKKSALFFFVLFWSLSLFAQNIDDRKVTFEYIRLPLRPVPKSVKNYQPRAIQEYEPAVRAKKEAFANKFDANEQKFAFEMEAYNRKVKEAGARYAEDMIEYRRKVDELKMPDVPQPVLILPDKPVKKILVDSAYYQKLYNPETLADTYIKLNGYKKATDNAVVATALLKGFDYMEPYLKVVENIKTKNAKPYKVYHYYYEISYRHPMGIKVEVPGEGVAYQEYFEELNKYDIWKTPLYNSEAELKAAFDKNTQLSALEDQILAKNMKYVNQQLNNLYGYERIKGEEKIFVVSGKKFSYADYTKALEAAITGLNQLAAADLNKAGAIQSLNIAIDIWENALKEFQPEIKKARITENVAVATCFNIAILSIYADAYNKGEIYLNKILALGTSRKEEKRVEEIRLFLKDQQSRYEAYKTVNQ